MKTKRMLDLIMVGILPILMAYELVGEATHEVLGATMVLLVMVHHLLNRSWHTHLTRGPYTPLRIAYTVMDVVLLGLLAAQGISGVMMAKHTFGFLPHVGRRSAARVVHLMGAYWGFVLMGLHAGMHMTTLGRKIAARIGQLSKMARRGACVALAASLLYGGVAFVRRGLPLYMLRMSEFAFFDFEEPLAFFFADYLFIMLLTAAAGMLVTCVLQQCSVSRMIHTSHKKENR